MQRYKTVLQYDGSYFFGWQLQAEKRTVQGELEGALHPLGAGERIKVIGAGRTDTGVHAFGQVAHFDLDTTHSLVDIKNALNARTHEAIDILSVEKVSEDFHARFSAKVRHYIYQIFTGTSLLYRNQAWPVQTIDVDYLQSLTSPILGTHDFLSFSKFNPELGNTNCTIYDARWMMEKSMVTFHIRANRFLHHMVRYLVGTMIAVTQEKVAENDFVSLVNLPRRDVHIFKAPPNGLILNQVSYD